MHLAIYFPGGSIPGQDPFDDRLAWITIRSLEQAGALVRRVHYDDDVIQSDLARFKSGIQRDMLGALAYYQPDVLTVVGKSRGTHALRIVCTEDFDLPEDTRLIWLTPTWRTDESWEAARSNTLPSLHIVGLADHAYHLPDRHREVFGETVAIPGADHRLEVPDDIGGTLDAWRTMADAILRFAARV